MPPTRRQPERAHTKHQSLARPTKSTVSSTRREKAPSPGPDPNLSQDDLVLTIMAAIYWDINFMATLFKMLCEEPTAEHLRIYDEFWDNTLYTVEKAVWDHAYPPIQGIVPLRFAQFIKDFGWRLFAICAQSEAFLLACQQENDTVWNALTKVMADENRSIDIFARTRGLNWQATLLRVASQLPELEHVLVPEPNLAMYHPGQVVITENGRLRLARFQDKTQVHIEKLAYNQEVYGGVPDPTLRKMEWGRCRMCRKFETCECVFIPDAGDLVELTEYQDKGIGVRALTNIKEGDVLGEYIGEFVPETDKLYKHCLYDMEFEVPSGSPEGGMKTLATVCPAHLGNWTRFMNHSCDPSADFFGSTVGKHGTIIVKALRDIPIFEEITANYGDGYWRDRICLCGSANCIHHDAQNPEEAGV